MLSPQILTLVKYRIKYKAKCDTPNIDKIHTKKNVSIAGNMSCTQRLSIAVQYPKNQKWHLQLPWKRAALGRLVTWNKVWKKCFYRQWH